jgi:hypothetical protein
MTAKPPKQPKLRSSCDGCGAAKLKCDRRQPECGRCTDLSITCVYGVSRKMGKPPRDRVGQRGRSPEDRQPSYVEKRKCDDNGYKGDRARRSGSDTTSLKSAASSGSTDLDSAWGSADGDDFSQIGTDTTMLDNTFPQLTHFSSMDLGDWALPDELATNNLDTDMFATFEWPEMETTATPPSYTQHFPGMGGSIPMPFGDNLPPQGDCSCLRETHEILNNLSLINPDKTPTAAAPGPMATAANHFPLDYVLNLNRECSGRLGKLLTCTCAGCPHLALLHASIISQVLKWYHQESSATTLSPSHPSSLMSAALNENVAHAGSSLPGIASASPWSATTVTSTATIGGANTPKSSTGSTPMAMGCFIIDDERVQVTLRIQLLLAELTRIGSLIKIFSTRSSKISDVSASGTVDPLYKSLGSWLAKEHSSIEDLLRSKLREISM